MDINFKKIYKNTLFIYIALGLVVGVVVILLFGEYYFNKWYLERVALEGEEGASRIVIQSPEKVEVTQDLRVKEVFDQVEPALAVVYQKKTIGKDIISQIYQSNDLVGYAVILTSDGWLVMPNISNKDLDTKNTIVAYNKQIKDAEKIVADQATGTVLIKISAVDLPVIKFGSIGSLSSGDQLMAINKDEIKLVNLANAKYINPELLHSSEEYYKYLLLSEDQIAAGSAVINFLGDLVGMVVSRKDSLSVADDLANKAAIAVPIDFLQRSIKLILRESEIDHPYLGVNFIDISSSIGLNVQATKGLEAGALLYGRGAARAVHSDSPLVGKLSEGDIITKINNQEINSQVSLSELVLSRQKGDIVEIEYVADKGEKEIIEIELK
jgi:S1-C subfamily serine protease